MPKFVLTMEEVYGTIRKHYMLSDDVEIVFDSVKIRDSDQKDSEWYYVPSDWHVMEPPVDAERFDRVEVVFRNDTIGTGYPYDFSWRQDIAEDDIIKYRKIA